MFDETCSTIHSLAGKNANRHSTQCIVTHGTPFGIPAGTRTINAPLIRGNR